MRKHNSRLVRLSETQESFADTRKKILLIEQKYLQKQLLAEATAELLLEALSEEELIELKSNIEPKLNALTAAVPETCPTLKTSVNSAIDDVKKFAQAGFFKKLLSGGIDAVMGFLGVKTKENPLLKTMTYLSGLENLFGKLRELSTKLNKDVFSSENSEKKLGELFDKDENNTLKKSLLKALTPQDSVFSTIASMFGKGIPYVPKGAKLVDEIFDTKIGDLVNIIKALQTGKKTSELASTAREITSAATGGAEAGGGAGGGKPQPAPGGGQPIASVDQLAAAILTHQAAQSNKPTPPADETKKKASEITKKFLASVTKKAQESYKEITDKDVQKVIKVLLQNKKLSSEFALNLEGRRLQGSNRLVTLSLADVSHARKLFIESGGSTKRWVKLLVEREINNQKAQELYNLFVRKIKDKNIQTLKDLKKAFETSGNSEQLGALPKAMKKNLINVFKEENPKVSKKELEQLFSGLGPPVKDQEGTGSDSSSGVGQIEELKSEIERLNAELRSRATDGSLGKEQLIGLIDSQLDYIKDSVKSIKILIKSSQDKKLELGDGFRKLMANFSSNVKSFVQNAENLKDNPNVEGFQGLLDDQTTIDQAKFQIFDEINSTEKADKLKSEIQTALDSLKSSQDAFSNQADELAQEKEARGAAETKAQELAAELEGNKKVLDTVAKLMNLSDEDKKNPDALVFAIQKMIEEKPEQAARVAGAVNVDLNAGTSTAMTKTQKLAKQFQKELEDIDQPKVIAILDAIPDWLLEESRRLRQIALGRRLLNSNV